ncbi:MAG: hypothetical protein HC806_04070 [Anaerolineae bacterium]|nr:hypothetical protein [Anaerolineae bacterium]
MEDGDGYIGLPYLPTLSNNLAIQFKRPASTAKVKVFPTYQSGLTESGAKDFLLQVRNTGESGPDRFDMSGLFGGMTNPGNSAWIVTFWEEDGSAGLLDSNANSIPDTGLLAEGETKTILVRLQPPSNSTPIGNYTTYQVTASSVLDSSKKSTAIFQAAVPAGHFLGFGNSAGLDLVQIDAIDQDVFDVSSSGTNPSLAVSGGNYFYAWEAGSDLEYAVLSYSGKTIKPATKLTDNASATYQTTELNPFMAVTSTGRIGIVWVRRLFDPGPPFRGENYNIYFAILDARGTLFFPQLQ